MKNLLRIFLILFIADHVYAQAAWTPAAMLPGAGLTEAVSFTIGNYGYVGSGSEAMYGNNTKALWQYDPANDSWTQMSDCPYHARKAAVAFSIGNYGYFGTGIDSMVNG